MKIFLDCSSLVIGGALQVGLGVLHNAARTTAHEWHLALSAQMSAQVDDDLAARFHTVARLAPRKRSWSRVWQIRRRLPQIEKAIRPDLVFTVFGPPYWDAKAPHLVGFANSIPLYPESLLWEKLSWSMRLRWRMTVNFNCRGLRWSDYLVVETETIRRRLESVLGFPSSRVFVVGNSYSPLFEHGLDRNGYHNADTFIIFVPASYYPHKNLEIIPETAAALLKRTNQPFEFVFTLPPEGRPWANIRARAGAAGVERCLRTVGAIPHGEIARLYQTASAVFLPTLLESSTAVYPESFMAGIPLCTSDLDFARELCGDAALYFDPCSPEAAAKVLLDLMRNAQLRDDLPRKGRSILADRYPTPEQKWREQLNCIEEAARRDLPRLVS